TIATGFVVDDAIVMLENIARHREQGASPLQAALRGAAQIGFTLISLTLSLIAVLIPLLFMGDLVGRLFHEFAVTLAVAIAISLVVSLTLTPMMCARMLTPTSTADAEEHGAGFMGRVIRRYGRMLDWALDRQPLMLLVMLATIGLTVLLYVLVPKGFFPAQDSGVIQVVTEAPQDISFAARSEEHTSELQSRENLVCRLLSPPSPTLFPYTTLFRSVIRRYGRMLDWALDRQPLMLLVMLATIGLTVLLYVLVPKGFFPAQDSGVIQVVTEAPQDISFAA